MSLLTNLFGLLTRNFPAARHALWRRWYDFLGSRYQQDSWTFMNYGYVPAPPELPVSLEPADRGEQHCAALYHTLLSRVPIKSRTLVEVGSGRGGGCSFAHRYHHPRKTIGIDFSREAVRFCRRRHPLSGLHFKQGDAANLPLPDARVDVVLNVESSHCYPDRPRFLREVARVLKPGGHFLYADFFTESEQQEVESTLAATGMRVVERREITPNVLAAMAREEKRKRREMQGMLGPILAGPFGQFAGLKGSEVHEAFRTRKFRYVARVLEK